MSEDKLKKIFSEHTKDLPRPPGEWSQILERIKKGESRKSWFNWSWVYGVAAAVAVVLLVANLTSFNSENQNLADFLLESGSYLDESQFESELDYGVLIEEL